MRFTLAAAVVMERSPQENKAVAIHDNVIISRAGQGEA
jgi:hypothetical protein